MTVYATINDLENHWRDIPTTDNETAEQKILEAHIEVRGLYPDIDDRVESGDLDSDVVKLVICRMVKRALQPPAQGMEGIRSVQQTQAGFTQAVTFTGGDGSLYLTKADKRLLNRRNDDGAVFSVMPGGSR